MRGRYLIAGTLLGGIVLSLLSWITAAILPPRYKQFKDVRAVVEAIRANVSENDIYTAPQGVFVSVSNPLQNVGARIVSQFGVEFAVAFGLSLILGATRIYTSPGAGGFLGSIGLVAGIETHFPMWNWAGFPTSYLVAGSGYLAANWLVTGLVLGALRQKLDAPLYTGNSQPLR
jgi:hypothetical protein